MTDAPVFISPDGNPLAGALQTAGEASWPVIFEDAASPRKYEYEIAGGPGSQDWETITLDGEVIFLDETGDDWLARHLIPLDLAREAGHPETYGLSPETCRLMKRDLFFHLALRDAEALAKTLDDDDMLAADMRAIVGNLEARAAAAKADARDAKAADIAIMEAGGWEADGEPKAPPVDITRMASAGLEHLRQARACFEAAGNVRTVERVRAAISSGKGAVRAAGYRKSRLAEGGARG